MRAIDFGWPQMSDKLPDRETAERMGWTHQIDWTDEGLPCFIRCKSKDEAERRADDLRSQWLIVTVTDLREALMVH